MAITDADRERLHDFRASLDERNVDNVARTASYLELYAWTRRNPPDLPWIFMAHLVSRNAGYLMTDVARRIAAATDPMLADAMRNLFVLLERANFLIFHDAWHHVCAHLAGDTASLAPPRTPAFMCDAWRRYEAAGAPSPARERALVLDLVHNEQHLIEHRAVHHPELAPGLRLLFLIEATGKERPLVFPWPDATPPPEIRAGKFAVVERRIATGTEIFDRVLADHARRAAMFDWARAHPHTGSREVHGGPAGPGVREVWPVALVRTLWRDIHAPPAPDARYP
ncbi:MAG: DUF2515 family protein [Deltaproteobacteria bacterium]|nr:DUF2515 family protein [Deltaproteobacteria bacterium]